MIVFDLKNAPHGLFNSQRPEAPFDHGVVAWKNLGLWDVVRGLGGNATLLDLADGRTRLQTWQPGEEYLPLNDNSLTMRQIDEELSIGWDKQPTAEDFDNGNPLGLTSQALTLADGNVWEIPEIRDPGGTRLPRDLVKDRKTGGLLLPLKIEYQDLWHECEYWTELLLNGFLKLSEEQKVTFSYERALTFATQVLSLRYRFCDAVQAALRVIDTVNVQRILWIATGCDLVIEELMARHQKKSASAAG